MITLHHLNDSRSQRILWLLEEMNLEYRLEPYQRDAATRLAPPELDNIHPLGKAPVITDGDLLIHESGSIVDYLIGKYGEGKFAPPLGSDDYVHYGEWMHYAEGSAMLPLMLRLYTSRLGDGAAPLKPRIDGETHKHLAYVNSQMTGKSYFMGDDLTGADIMMSFPLEVAKVQGVLGPFEALTAYVDRIHARPAFKRSLEKGGAYAMAAGA